MLLSVVIGVVVAAARAADEGACAAGSAGSAACSARTPRGNSLLQSRRLTKPGATVRDDEDEDEEASELEVESDSGSGEGWFTSNHMSFKLSTEEYYAHLVRDGDSNTWGGAVVVVVDLGNPFKITKLGADWRVCQCATPGSLVIESSMNAVDWVTAATPTLTAWGDHVPDEHIVTKESQIARYWRFSTTASAPVAWVGFWELGFWGNERSLANNVFGWYHSYAAGNNGLSGTEIVDMQAHKGKLYAGTGYWMNMGDQRYAEVVSLDCPLCTWTIDYTLPYAGRVEALRSITWTNGPDGNPIAGGPDIKLIATHYMDYTGEARCIAHAKNDKTPVEYSWADETYYRKTPFTEKYFSARSMALHRDTVTGVDRLFFSTGRDGVVSAEYSTTSRTNFLVSGGVEAGPLDTRPLSMTTMDGKLYLTAGSYVYRRTDGSTPSWSQVVDMMVVDPTETVDEAVGGLRGLVQINNPASPTGHSLLFAWTANEQSKGCMYRLDPDGDALNAALEGCVADWTRDHFGKNVYGLDTLTAFSIANYNYALEVPDRSGTSTAVYLVGYEVLLYSYSTYELPNTQQSTASSGKTIGFYAGSGFLVRRASDQWEVREPSGPRFDPTAVSPMLVATRTYAVSPFQDDFAVYFGGYDANFFGSVNTAWIYRGTYEAVFEQVVPCQLEVGCGHTLGMPFTTGGCQICRSHRFYGQQVSFWQEDGTSSPCQEVLDWVNGQLDTTEGSSTCEYIKDWVEGISSCCDHKGCDFCAATGKNWAGGETAGTDEAGGSYTCDVAHAWTLSTGESCADATSWWSAACCM
eukprot:CAMPEP_0204532038 /NCGR_PEP_ID=MMETSP0661-20131031/11504_1 /ASSEMBLY_ACC=CAM_ASM_000606 /TAXON_ID=109239 /ORGANISM="Alexandrium margalefi, Strain AMGDE01CS-322" /LENGTH=805 /DNA_ID=CAMNT_0051538243 /DNA_START=58 /DNA_END=2475 /DNA_ORIENTATION=+